MRNKDINHKTPSILKSLLLLTGITLLVGCKAEFDVDQQIEYCHQQVKRTLTELAPIDYTVTPRNIGADEVHWNLRDAKTPEEWCSGFFPGILWMCGERKAAEGYTRELEYLAFRPAYDHDLGFQMIGSYLKGWTYLEEQGGDAETQEHYRQVLFAAADTLATLYNPKVGTLLSWPRNVGMFGGHNTIIDNMINLELLFWVDQQRNKENSDTNNSGRLRTIAINHADTTMKYHFRPDGSVNHVAVYDTLTGRHLHNCNHQGLDDNSLWSRGQAWAIYGYTMVYRYTQDPKYLDFVQKVTDMMLSQLPEDKIPYWDMRDPKIPNTYRDASAAAIIASALIELAEYVPADKGTAYLDEAKAMLTTLSSASYQSRDAKPSFLLHAVGNMPAGSEIDASINYADYYYIEALSRLRNYQNQH